MWIPWNSEEHAALIEVAAGRKPPSLVIRGGQVLNVFTGRLEQKDVAVSERRIAWVGPLQESGLLLDESVQIVEADGLVLVPGYIEPHAHPFQLYHPVTLAEAALVRGTTVLIHDNLFFFSCMEPEEAFRLLEAMADSPVKHFWWCRFDPQALLSAENERLYENGRVRAFLRYPAVVQAGELTDWLPLLEGDEKMAGWVREAHRLGKRVEGHAPGASYRTLSRLAAAGVTGDHESITAEEVWRRLELGYMVTLRHSSIRPDLPELIRGLADRDVPWNRLMLTTDGATPPYFRNGFTDYILRVAMEAGCPPVRAYQMVTITPAI
jgi:adenine deaminase